MHKKYEKQDFQDFFEELGFEVTESSTKKRTFGRVVTALSGVLPLCMLAGALFVPPVFVWASAAAHVTVPISDSWKKLPSELPEVAIGERNRLFDKNGNVFAEIWTEDRINLESLDEISPHAINALIATEDKRFYQHGGFDPIGTLRSAVKKTGGGSGITQQLVKNLQFYDMAGKDNKDKATEESLNRKLRELKYAISYENSHSKDEILLKYFNTVAFGGPNVYSIESASWYFFNKSAKDLSLAESAALVASVKNPSYYNLDSEEQENVDAWKGRQATVLDRMVTEGHITEDEANVAKTENLTLFRESKSGGSCAYSQYPFYCDYVVKYLLKSPKLGETDEERAAVLAKGGLNIYTHLDPVATDVMNRQLAEDFGNTNRLVAPSALVEPGTGGVKAFAFNREYGSGEGKTTINLADVPAGTGSTYKMIALAAAFESGMTESDLRFGSPCPYYPGSAYDAPPGGYGNSNGCGFQNGYLDYKQATAWSSNTWFLSLATKVGMGKVIKLSEDMNLRTDGLSERSLAMVLGSKENTPIDMAAAYATFSNNGVFCPATPIVKYEYRDGSTPVPPETYDSTVDSCRSVISPASASGVLRAMRANTYPGEVSSAFGTAAYIPGYDAVGKSGTNEHLNQAWAQVSKNYSVFTDIYDMDNPNNGFNGNWRGQWGSLLMSTKTGSDLLRNVVDATNPERKPLDYNSKDKKLVHVPVDSREMFTVPSFKGMSPEQAILIGQSLEVPVHLSKETREKPDLYSPNVIVEQSIEPGTQLPKGTKKELILYLGE